MREAAQHVAEETLADLAEVRCVTPPALLVRRPAGRKPGTAHVSDVTAGVLRETGFDPWPGAAEVDTSVRSARSVASAVAVAAAERVLGKADRRPEKKTASRLVTQAGGPTVWGRTALVEHGDFGKAHM
jgi:hypothetical protein